MKCFQSNFNGDISNWGVSNVLSVKNMFKNSKFKGDIFNWTFLHASDALQIGL
jgi:hypothetical protein